MPEVQAAPAPSDTRLAYERDGYIVLRRLFSAAEIARAAAEAEALLEHCRPLISVRNLRCRWQTNVTTGTCDFETFDPIIDLSPACRDLALDDRLLAALAGLYGEPACLFKDKLIYKPPGLSGYGLHQDWIAWPGFPRSFLTVLVPFDAADGDNGATEVFPGYHAAGSLSPEDGDYHELPPDLVDLSRGVLLELRPGDVAVFSGFTPHRSAPNRSTRWRRQLYLSYNKHSDGGPQRERHYAEFHVWLHKKYAEYGKTDVYFE
jgi:ectoine hydroxylase-related dioxygenase (phytanoyl-CoA dioxygenase family)